MSKTENYSVAVPWSLSHYIPLNGFHPLYRSLFDQRPENVTICAWDNVEISKILRSDPHLRANVLRSTREVERTFSWPFNSSLTKAYLDYYWAPNITLTDLLPGQIEFHHTAPFPTFRRPFVFHCESFAPVFFPFAHQGTGKMRSYRALQNHYRSILASPLCLGIFSHIPETLRDLSIFFGDSEIDRKLYQSKIGLSPASLPNVIPQKNKPLSHARFLFVNSAHQNPASFFHRGGHIVLRFWKEFISDQNRGSLYLRCTRPRDEALRDHGVDMAFLCSEEGSSVIWIEDYLLNDELNALMADAHFFLLPSASLHSASIMQAMAMGTVPVVSDTLGTALYVTDDQNGIVLKGVFSANWDTDPETGVLVDHYSRNPSLDEDLVSQLTQRILALLDTPHAYEKIRHNALERSRNQFSGEIFSKDFWSRVSGLHLSQRSSRSTRINVARRGPAQLNECMLADSEWPRVFGGATQPHMRLYTGRGRVSELGGAFIHAFGSPAMEVNDWSVLAEHVKLGAPPLKFAKSIRDLEGSYLDISGGGPSYRGHDLIAFMSRALQPYPALHHFGARVLATARQCRHRVLWLLGADKTRRPDIELVVEGLSGFNIVRCLGKYYAIPQSEGAFVLEKVEAGEYCACFRGNTVWAIRRKIAVASKAELTNPSRSHHDSLKVELVSEGVLGFNIVRCADRFYAIPQSEGTFDHTRIHSGGYSRMFSGRSAEEVHKLLKEAVASLI